jgi:hypothetical protein
MNDAGHRYRLGESATGSIVRFSGPMAAKLLLATYRLPRRRGVAG